MNEAFEFEDDPLNLGERGEDKFACCFSLNNSETIKVVPWHFVVFTNILSETFVSLWYP